MTTLLSRIVSAAISNDPMPFAVIRRHESDVVDILVGRVMDVEELDQIPLAAGPDAREVLTMVPFRQISERGFAAYNDGYPLRCLVVSERQAVSQQDALNLLPRADIPTHSSGFQTTDEEYAEVVRRVITNEIGQGEGANFVISRAFRGETSAAPALAVLTWFRTLLSTEQNAYWTFAVHTPGHSLVGATPERHVSLRSGQVIMNPISGTYRHPSTGPTVEGVLNFLSDTKECDELFMVVDEEMKMMSRLCPDGGRILGPYLKQMSKLTHTEYLLEGRTTMDPRDVLRETMFAPTVTGSPIKNACSVINKYESGGRGYYSGVLALFEPESTAGLAVKYGVDAPILIRTAHIDSNGLISVSAGATLVRSSTPEGEVAETHAKASGVLTTLGLIPAKPTEAAIDLNSQPGVAQALLRRNNQLAPFWIRPQVREGESRFTGLSAVVVDCEDQFADMLAHQLRHLGLAARVIRWDQIDDIAEPDLIVFGPGPGDPRDTTDVRIASIHQLLTARLETKKPLLAVCLSHQILATLAGLEIRPLSSPHQGVRLTVDVFGDSVAIGFYNTFTAVAPRGLQLTPRLGLHLDREGEAISALRGPCVSSIQGHLESVLSSDGLTTLVRLLESAVAPPAQSGRSSADSRKRGS